MGQVYNRASEEGVGVGVGLVGIALGAASIMMKTLPMAQLADHLPHQCANSGAT
jgi:hypothetical protein